MDYSNPAGTLFRDLGGLDDTIMRLQYEVSRVEYAVKDEQIALQSHDIGKSVESTEMQMGETVSHSEALVPYRLRLLLKALLRAIALGTYASGNATRLHGSEESALPACLCSIFRHAKEFGGGVFSLAASVMSDLINKDPTCFPVLQAAGLPAAFLDSIVAGVLPSSDAVGCIPHALDALCLNNSGLQAVNEYKALDCFVKIFTSKSYLKALSGDTPAAIASGLDELMRHAPSLRGPGVDACINILKTIAVIGGSTEETSCQDTEVGDLPTPMETDSEQASSSRGSEQRGLQGPDSNAESSQSAAETFLPDCINNTVQMLETIFQNADTCRVFIEKGGIEELLKLFTLPCLPVSFGGSSTAYNIFLTFRAFSSQHASTLTKAVCNVLKEHLHVTSASLCCSKLSDLNAETHGKVIRNLSAAECFLSLTTFLVRSLAPMMAEISTSTGNSDLFNDLGNIYRWVLWQISEGEENKNRTKKEEGSAGSTVAGTESNEENRENDDESEALPLLRYVNPGSRNRWGFESDFIPLLSTDQNERRSRRENVTNEILNHVARLGRLARSAAVRTVRGDIDSGGSALEALVPQESSKRKSADVLCFEMMVRLASAARGLYGALGKAMAVPSRHRDDAITINPAAKSIAASLASLFLKNLEFEGFPGPSSPDVVVSVKCRYLGKVVDDIMSVVLDTRKRTCNTLMVNCFFAFGTLKKLLTTFEATSQLLWSSMPMDTDAGKMDIEKMEDKSVGQPWLLDTLRSYTKLLECLVTSSLLLVPSSMAQLLVQPISGGVVSVPKDPENFVLALQAQVLEAIFPLWNHPTFPQCSPNLVESLCSIMKHVYSGVTEAKSQGTSNEGSSGILLNASPPDESAISVIVEMGFSRTRAEEALRRVGRNSVELAMEWLFSHPEETSQEEDELARALALSLGNGNDSNNEDTSGKGKDVVREEGPQLPPVEIILSTCMKLLQGSQTVVFPIADLMVTMCSRNKGEDRAKIVSYLISQVTLCKIDESESVDSLLSSASHLLALVLCEDTISREIAVENGIIGTAIDYLSSFKQRPDAGDKPFIPNWVTALLLVLDFMLQQKPKIDPVTQNISTSDEVASESLRPSSASDKTEAENVQSNPWETILGKPTGFMTEEQQKKTMSVACKLITMSLPAGTVQAILQLCARLTKTHAIAMQFLESGGLSALLNLPRTSLFPGFENVATAIIRHLLEDPQTLQIAMESEIRHSLAASLSRHNNRLSPRMFLTSMARVVARDPAIFMKAAATVCQIDESTGRPHVILAKEKDKEKEKERDKEKNGDKERERGKGGLTSEENAIQSGSKITESGAKHPKGYKKIPQSFSHVMEELLDVVANFSLPDKEHIVSSANSPSSVTAMEVDDITSKDKGKAKIEEGTKTDKSILSENSAALAKVVFILKLLTEIILMYSASVTVVLRRDTESMQGKVTFHGGPEAVGQGGFLYGILHRLVPPVSIIGSEKTPEIELLEKVSSKAAYFLVVVCMRSAEGRKRLFSEISKALVYSSTSPGTSVEQCSQPPTQKMRAFVDLLNTVLSSHTSSGGSQAPGVSTEMAKAMLDAGMAQALTTLLQVIDLDHPDAPKLAGGIAKVLEALTRAASSREQMHPSDQKRDSGGAGRHRDSAVLGGQSSDSVEQNGNNAHPVEEGPIRVDLHAAIRAMQALVGDDLDGNVHLDHEMGLGGDDNDEDEDDDEDDDHHLEADDEEFMHEAAEVVGNLENVAPATISFRMEHREDDDLGEDEEEEDMDGEVGEEEEEEDEDQDEDELEEDVALSPPDTDVDDQEHELEEEYDEDMAEEEEEEDEWRENRIIEVRWRDGSNGFNHVQVLGHADAGSNPEFSMDPFQGMNIDYLFGAFRRSSGMDRRRGSAYGTFDRTGSEGVRNVRHPLLTRPNLASSNGWHGSSPWAAAGTVIGRDMNLGVPDVTRLLMYDGAMVDHVGDSLFGERGVGGQDSGFRDIHGFPRLGRRSGRTDSRFSNWTDDGQLQGGAVDVALAHAFEEQFLANVPTVSSGDQTAAEPAPNTETADPADTRARGSDAANMREEPSAEPSPMEHQGDVTGGQGNDSQHEQAVGSSGNTVEGQNNEGNRNTDVEMHDGRGGTAGKDVEAASQDSSGSGATVGESLRSLEVEIGSADGHDEGERPAGPSDLCPQPRDTQALALEQSLTRPDTDENMEGPTVVVSSSPRISMQPPPAEIPSQRETGDQEHSEGGENSQQRDTDATMSSIDPAFLEALPEDLRAEVLASQQTQAPRAENHQPSTVEDIDPEFLAALPPEIQAEVLQQQQAQLQQQHAQRLLQAQQVEGQPVDMDSASIIATFPPELREEVLLTASEPVLNALPPALLAEARLLRERAMTQLQARTIFGPPHRPGGRRNSLDVGARGIAAAIDRGVGAGLNFDAGRRSTSGISAGGKKLEVEGKPLLDTPALKALLRLLRLAQPLGKGLLQRLLYNLCSHSSTCATLVRLLLDMLRPDVDASGLSADGAPAHRLYGCQWNVVYARPQPSDGVPPLVSRRVLEILTYLAKHQSLVASLLLYFESKLEEKVEPHADGNDKGKSKVDEEMIEASLDNSQIPLILLLKLLSQPLYSRSSAHLEQVLGLIDVVTSKARDIVESHASLKVQTSETAQTASLEGGGQEPGEVTDTVNTDAHAPPSSFAGAGEDLQARTGENAEVEASTSGSEESIDPAKIFSKLPSVELNHLCLLLAREGLSDLAYTRVTEVLNKIAELVPTHRRLFIAELANAAKNLSDVAVGELQALGAAESVQLTTASTVGAAILRVLLALSSLKASGLPKNKDQDVDKDDDESMAVVRDLNGSIEPLWQALSNCAVRIESRLNTAASSRSQSVVGSNAAVMPPLSPGAQKILPFIEGFFVLCDKLRSAPASPGLQELGSATACEIKETASSASLMQSTAMQQQHIRKSDEKGLTFVWFADRHRRLLNAFVRQNPGLLEKSLSLLLKTPRLIDFDNKRAYFRSRIRQQHEQQHYAPLRIAVRRAYVLEDSYNQLRMRTPDELKGRLTVQFQGEEGIDAGGLTREWYQLLSRVIFDKGALLFTTVGNESSFQPNPNSVYQTEHLSYFKFVGRVVAKALFDGQLLDVYFTRSFYKHILGVKVTYHDIEAVDPDFYKNLKWVLENTVNDALGLTFSIDADEEKHILYERTEVMDHELIPGGRNIRVTEENKHEYVDLVAEHRLTTAIRPQINAFLEGFNELVPRELISIFNDKELELLISGLPEIDLEDLKANTEYTGYTAASPVVQWFWEVVGQFNKEDMARLLQFITGTSKVSKHCKVSQARRSSKFTRRMELRNAFRRHIHVSISWTFQNIPQKSSCRSVYSWQSMKAVRVLALVNNNRMGLDLFNVSLHGFQMARGPYVLKMWYFMYSSNISKPGGFPRILTRYWMVFVTVVLPNFELGSTLIVPANTSPPHPYSGCYSSTCVYLHFLPDDIFIKLLCTLDTVLCKM
ncbi:hypothetical protein KP509_29G011900 [Ceratopteris richardii]|uniref:HECT-type E3 ubiquitin transferase n=1 Tax=Ceratopteris richardii TaxID=49495 RepID=A0A8T2R4L4_CERRI|nr:hypothetical protein KP509_29G011900 [Ceratopteris richardii]